MLSPLAEISVNQSSVIDAVPNPVQCYQPRAQNIRDPVLCCQPCAQNIRHPATGDTKYWLLIKIGVEQ